MLASSDCTLPRPLAALIRRRIMDLQLVYPSTSVLMTPKVNGFQVYGDGFVRWDEVTIQS